MIDIEIIDIKTMARPDGIDMKMRASITVKRRARPKPPCPLRVCISK